jgi:hypothetical protein
MKIGNLVLLHDSHWPRVSLAYTDEDPLMNRHWQLIQNLYLKAKMLKTNILNKLFKVKKTRNTHLENNWIWLVEKKLALTNIADESWCDRLQFDIKVWKHGMFCSAYCTVELFTAQFADKLNFEQQVRSAQCAFCKTKNLILFLFVQGTLVASHDLSKEIIETRFTF